MKRFIRPLIILTVSLTLALCAEMTHSARSSNLSNTSGAALFFQNTSTPQPKEDRSVVGSTDGIVIMGGVITLIVIAPILARRKAWMKSS